MRTMMDRRLDLCAVRARAGYLVLLVGLATLAGGCGKEIPQTEVTIDSAPESGADAQVAISATVPRQEATVATPSKDPGEIEKMSGE